MKRRSNGPLRVSGALALTLALCAARAEAQAPPTPEQRRQASAAYDSGVAARASGNHASAASFFETADRLAPSTVALGNAIRAHRDAHSPQHDARAATLSVRLITRYPNDTRAVTYARNVVQELGPSLVHVTVQCDHCDVEVDHALSPDLDMYLEPGAHSIVGYWGSRTRSRDFTGAAGATEAVTLETPPEAPANNAVANNNANTNGNNANNASTAPSGPPVVTQPPPSRGGLHPAVAITGLVLTLGLGGTLGWSVYDMYAGVPAYEMAAMQGAPNAAQLLADGQGREIRTDILIAATAVVGAATIGVAIFTRWSSPRVEVAPAVASVNGPAPGFTLLGSF